MGTVKQFQPFDLLYFYKFHLIVGDWITGAISQGGASKLFYIMPRVENALMESSRGNVEPFGRLDVSDSTLFSRSRDQFAVSFY